MTRTAARELAVRFIYAVTATGAEPEAVLDGFFDGDHYKSMRTEDKLFEHEPGGQTEYIRALVLRTSAHRTDFDAFIEKYSRGWKIERITRTAAACLRCAMCEILFMTDFDVNTAIAINESVEICKGYDEPETVAFVNGVLGSFVRGELGESETLPDETAES